MLKRSGNPALAGKYLLSTILLWGVTTVSLFAESCGQAKSVRRFVVPAKCWTDIKQSKGVPHEINYQGWIGDTSDTNGITDVLNMTFRLYDAETGGTLLWNETQSAVTVDKGIFNVLLGSVSSIPSDIFTGSPLWLETQVATDTLAPRKKLVSVGYAIKSEFADSATYADTAGYFKMFIDSSGIFLRSDSSDTGYGNYWFRKNFYVDSLITARQMKSEISVTEGTANDYAGWFKRTDNSSSSIASVYIDGNYKGSGYGFGLHCHITDSSNVVGCRKGAYLAATSRNSLVWGAHITASNTGNKQATACHMCVGSEGTGEHVGLDYFVRGKNIVRGMAGRLYGLSKKEVYNLYLSIEDSADGKRVGIYNEVHNSVPGDDSTYGATHIVTNNSTGNVKGLEAIVTAAGTGDKIAVYGNTGSDGAEEATGVSGYASGTGNGDIYGGDFKGHHTSGGTGHHYGVRGRAYGGDTAIGVYGFAQDGSSENWAGFFKGNVNVTNTLTINSNAVLNEGGYNADTRIEGVNEPNLFFVDANVNRIGIGTDTPERRLDVYSNIHSFSQVRGGQSATVLFNDEDGRKFGLGSGLVNNGCFSLYDYASATERIRVDNIGRMGIGIIPLYPIHVGNGAYCSAAGVWTDASSRDYKENIVEVSTEEAMETINKLKPVRFNYKVDKEDEYVGFIAEDVPEFVAMKDRKGMSAMDVVAVLTKVVQTQQKEIELLRKEVEILKKGD